MAGEEAADLIESRAAGALRHQLRQPDAAASHGLSAALLRPIAEFLRAGGDPADVEHSLTVVRIAMEDIAKGLHQPDEALPGERARYNEGA